MRGATAAKGSWVGRRSLLVGGFGLAAAPGVFASAVRDPRAILGDAVRSLSEPGRAPGASAAVALKDGRVVAAAAGFADVQRRILMTPQTRLMSGSTGKTFAAAAVMSVAADGRLDLDAPVARWFRDEPWFGRLPNADRLTLRRLLQHASGFPQFLDLPGFSLSFIGDTLLGRSTGYSPRRMLAFILGAAPAAPLDVHHYSDLNYDLAGLTLEKATGRSYYEVLRERVLSRLGGDDVVPANRPDIPGLATGYAHGDIAAFLSGTNGRSTDGRGVLKHDPSLEWAGGGLAFRTRALARFWSALATGRIVTAAAFAEMARSSLPLPGAPPAIKARYGLGMFVAERPGLGTYYSHSGYYPGYETDGAYFPDGGIAVAVQMNTDHGVDPNGAVRDLARAFL